MTDDRSDTGSDDAVASAVRALRGEGPLAPALRQRIADQLEALVAEVAQLRRRTGERRAVEWSPELDARVLTLLAARLSYRVVARRMSVETGQTITKDAIVGRAHRIEAPPRPSPIRTVKPCRERAEQQVHGDLPTDRAPRSAKFLVSVSYGATSRIPLLAQGCHRDVHEP